MPQSKTSIPLLISLLRITGKTFVVLLILILLYWTILATIISFNNHRIPLKARCIVEDIAKSSGNKECLLITQFEADNFKHALDSQNVIDIGKVINISNPGYIGHALSYLAEKYKIPIFVLILKDNKTFRESFDSKGLEFPLKLISEVGYVDGYYSLYEYGRNYK